MAGNNQNTGLILVDLQHAFSPDQKTVDNIATALHRYDFVIALRHVNKPNSIFETELNFTRCYEGDADAQNCYPPYGRGYL